MNEEPKSIWKKSWKGWRALPMLVLLLVAAGFLGALTSSILHFDNDKIFGFFFLVDWLIFTIGAAVAFLVLLGFFRFIRWLCCWRNFKRFLFGLACFATLIALFYAEEDWRGKHDWQKFKRAEEAKGEKFDWQSIVPPPVPDDQNFAMAPIWVESIKATLGPKNSKQWFGDNYAENGRTNFTDRLALEINRNNNGENPPNNGYWAKGIITDLKPWQAYYRAPVQTNRNSWIMTNEFPVAPQPQTPAKDVLTALSKFDPAIEELRKDSALPYSQFPIPYGADDKGAIFLPHLGGVKRCSVFLELRAIAELQNGQSEQALADVKLALYLVNSIRTEPFPISHLVRNSMLQLTLQPVYEGLAEHKWSDAQLVALDAELAKLDFLADYEFCQRGDLCFSPAELEYLRRTRNTDILSYTYSDYDYRKHSPEMELTAFVFRHCPGGWFYQNQLRYCRFALQNFLPALDASRQLAFPETANRANTALQKENTHPDPYNFIERRIVLAFSGELAPAGFVEKFAYAQSSLDLARTAIALERYRLAHGVYPASLDALAPRFMAKIPHDIIGGGPLHYRLTSDLSSQSSDAAGRQFVLYSIGCNETDDGGVVVLKKGSTGEVDRDQGDWVWRYPAK